MKGGGKLFTGVLSWFPTAGKTFTFGPRCLHRDGNKRVKVGGKLQKKAATRRTDGADMRLNYLWMSLEITVSSDSCCFLV